MAGAIEHVFVAPPIPTGGGKVIAAPFQFYTTGEDNLRIVSLNSLAGVTLKVQGRLVDAAGLLQAASWDHVPNSDRSAASSTYPLAAGSVLNLTVFANSGSPRIGQTFVIVQLVRGLGAAAIVLGTLLQGYVTAQQALAWPGSPCVSSTDGEPNVRNIIGAAPALGVNILEACPSNARWELMSLFFSLTTSATVVDRTPAINIQSGTTFGFYEFGNATPASVTQLYQYAQGIIAYSAGAPLKVEYLALPSRQFLRAGDTFGTFISGFQPGDQLSSAFYQVREWLEAA